MKKFKLTWVLILSLLFLFSIACQEESSLVGPENTSVSDQNQLDKKHHSDENPFSVSKTITVKKGGKISLKTSYDGPFGKKVKIKAEIKFKPRTVIHDEEFTMTLNPDDGMITFEPHMEFLKSASLSYTVKGVDFEELNIDKDDINFVYLDDEGEQLEVKKIWFKKDSFGIHKAKIGHFSRYGFTK